ncbi:MULTISPECIES: ABC transporter ATP-binding protein [Nocardiaceae]|uniref:Iron ABC transporter ATP-binding protein n=1 Tax=Rhodococcoides kyotonense TaxID=398843 RepID=A0A177Y757_9NOCA|nr:MULTISPECIES: ATP-binding cassette domain-containing protein [Rhodococcus]NIL77215.1 Fe(3+) dicitrate transport ATP-binding protein FecE [Rhodococcus sp. B10]OAK50958.1 iron ABC transporter ATP-binding protein [Rhodococcus kyotonensis]
MIEFVDVAMSYQDHRVLGPVTGTIAKGGITSLIGPNGAGKSTLLTVIGRLLDPTSGTVTVGGMDIRTTRSADLARHLSILRQDNHITARLTVRELVGFGRFPHSKGRLGPADTEHVDRALAFLELDGLAHRFLDQLSGGQRQRAFVAMVLAQDTDYVLLDEPLNNLDMKHSVLMMKQLRRAADELGKTIVLIVHDINFAAAYSDRIIALRDGIIVTGGTSDEMMQDHILSDVFDTSVRVHTIDGNRTAVYAR